MVAPWPPQPVQREHCRSLSLDSFAPHRITATAHANGALCWQRSQYIQTHGVDRCRSPSVGRGPGADLCVGRDCQLCEIAKAQVVGFAAHDGESDGHPR
jgi:hypothetical protein